MRMRDNVRPRRASSDGVMVTEFSKSSPRSVFPLLLVLPLLCNSSETETGMDMNGCRSCDQLSTSFQPKPLSDTELTNLNWVAGAPVPMPAPVSPTKKGTSGRNSSKHLVELSSFRADDGPAGASRTTPVKARQSATALAKSASDRGYCNGSRSVKETVTVQQPPKKKGAGKRRGVGGREGEEEEEQDRGKKPNCSYTSLIGLALMASEGGCLPVSEIYSYIEEEFPYFRNAPDGWKNSIRHNLSLNPAFRKVKDSIRWQGKKGYYWEVVPERRTSVEREVERYLRQEGRLKGPEITDGISPFPSCLQASIPTMPQTPSSVPMCSFQYCTGTQPYYDLSASMLRYYPPPRPPSPPPPSPPPPSTNPRKLKIPLARSATALLDTDISPSQFAGFFDHASSSTHSAFHDLFGFQLLPNAPSHILSSRYSFHPHLIHTQSTDGMSDFSPEFPWQERRFCNRTTGQEKTGRSMRLRRQALDLLTLPEDDLLYSTSSSYSPSQLASVYFSNSPNVTSLDHCRVSLEECFMTENSSGGEGGDGYMDSSEELPLPPLSGDGEMNHDVREEVMDDVLIHEGGYRGEGSEAVSLALSSPQVLASGTVRQKRKKGRGGKRKRPRIQTNKTPPSPLDVDQGVEVNDNDPAPSAMDSTSKSGEREKKENVKKTHENDNGEEQEMIFTVTGNLSYSNTVNNHHSNNLCHTATTRTLRPRIY